MNQKLKSIATFTIGGVCLGLVLLTVTNQLGFGVRTEDTLTSSMIPASINDTIDKAQLIVVGEVGSVIQRRTFSGYTQSGELLDGYTIDGNPHPKLPITDFEVKIERVIKDKDSIVGKKPIILRMMGDATAELKQATLDSEYPTSFTGDRHVFLLSRNPDGTYGFYYGPYSRLIVMGNKLIVSDASKQTISLEEGKTTIGLDELMELVK